MNEGYDTDALNLDIQAQIIQCENIGHIFVVIDNEHFMDILCFWMDQNENLY